MAKKRRLCYSGSTKLYGFGEIYNFEFIALKEKGSTNEVSIYFFRRDTGKIKSAKHGRHEVPGFWRLKRWKINNL